MATGMYMDIAPGAKRIRPSWRDIAEASGDASKPDAAALVLEAEGHRADEAFTVETFEEGVE